MLAKKTYKNQITLPKKISDNFRGVDYFEINESEGGYIILKPVKIAPYGSSSLSDVRAKIKKLGITAKDIEKAIKWARKK